MTIESTGKVQLFAGSGVELGGSASSAPTDFVALSQPVQAELNKIAAELSKIQATLMTGISPPGTAGGPVTFSQPYTAAYTSAGQVAAADVKAH